MIEYTCSVCGRIFEREYRVPSYEAGIIQPECPSCLFGKKSEKNHSSSSNRKKRIEEMCKAMMTGNAWTGSDLVKDLVQVATEIIDEIDKLEEE
jgi:hypothetical protein